jgi:hypothetical protein
MFEAAYWPLIYKPGTRLDWWQSSVLADVGFIVGTPVWIVIVFLGRFVNSSEIFLGTTGFILLSGYLWLIFALLRRIEAWLRRKMTSSSRE